MDGKRFSLAQLLRVLPLIVVPCVTAACASFGAPPETNTPPTLVVGQANAPGTPAVMAALQSRAGDEDALVREHVQWALRRHRESNAAVAD